MSSSNVVNEKTISAVVNKWRLPLGLDDRWDIAIKVFEDDEVWPHEGAVAAVRIDAGYFQATLHLNGERAREDAHTLEHILLHELVHIVLWPLSVVARDGLGEDHVSTWQNIMESAVEQMTRALLKKGRK